MYTLKAANTATLLWMDRGQTPDEFSFRSEAVPAVSSRHADISSAVNEAMRRMADGSSGNLQPWVLCERVLFEPAEIQMIDNHMENKIIDDHMAKSSDAVRRYYAEWA